MKKSLFILLFTVAFIPAIADHITGGEMYYTYQGVANGKHIYHVTLKLFMRCNSDRQFNDPNFISIFDKATNERIKDSAIAISHRATLNLSNPDPCITDAPQVCYEVAYYEYTVALPPSVEGYIIASEVNFRIRGINNLTPGATVGATYTCDIPGTINPTGPVNSSAMFTGSDLVIVCANNYFTYSFAATDPDGDQLQYSFCTAYAGGSAGVNGVPAGSPPYNPLPYFDPDFSENSPLGVRVGIDPLSGLISGIAPEQGIYVVTVCVTEIRDGVVLGVQRKDIQINIASCNVVAAQLDPEYMLCGTTRSISLANQATSPLILSTEWTVYSPAGINIFSTANSTLNYDFPVNGKYQVRLIINKGAPCTDTAFALVFVFPGLVPDFETTGICVNKSIAFTDRTTIQTGFVNSWTWDFGETGTTDISSLQHPSYTYPVIGTKTVRLIVTTTDGCRDTISKSLAIVEKPPIHLAFKDTLICRGDVLPLIASGVGSFSWTPLINITNPISATPIVSPLSTQTYYVHLNTDGCVNDDSVRVRVVNFVSLQTMDDTTICVGDEILLRIYSDGLRYNWTPVSQVSDPLAMTPFATTTNTTTYAVNATIGGCTTDGEIVVTTAPYPLVNAGKDTVICYNTDAQLQLQTNGSSWQWNPGGTLNNINSLTPIAHPLQTTSYIATVHHPASGCPKPSYDTVVVTVLPKIYASAGRDTVIVVGQPLQLHATGGNFYEWHPATNLSNYSIANPLAIFTQPTDGLKYKVIVSNQAGCADSAYIHVKVYKSGPTVYVPSAFTPNNDGRNDRLKPVAVGMMRVESFTIYNRWGQTVYSSKGNDLGWDGRVAGQIQASSSYVWMVKAIDYMGQSYFQKGVVTLVR